MNARPRPLAESHKAALLDWLRQRYRYGQGAPSDRAIAARLALRSTDDALALVRALEADGAIQVERDGLDRRIVLTSPPPLAGARPVTASMVDAARAAVPLPPSEPPATRGKPAPVSIRPTRPLFTPTVIDLAPVAAPAPALAAPITPEEATMPKPLKKPEAETCRSQIKVNCTANDHQLVAIRARQEGKAISEWTRDAIRAQLLATSPAATPTPPAGKPRLGAHAIRVANAEGDFWANISRMIKLGAHALEIEQQQARR